MIITVFGGSGFIGRQLVQKLAEAGHIVRLPTRDPVKAGILRTAGNPGQVVPMLVSFKREETLRAAIAGSEAVVNLLGILYETRRHSFTRIHADLPAQLARLSTQLGVKKFVQISALGASPDSPSAYARSKAAGEAAVLAAFPTATILQPSIVFGPEDDFFNRFAKLASISPALPLIGGGKTKFQPVYVGDVAEAILAALTKADTARHIYQLGGPRVASFRELLELMMKTIGLKRALIPLPFALATLKASVLQLFPHPLLTVDQVKLLKSDNIVSPQAKTLQSLGITPTAMEAVLPGYLATYTPGGPFAKKRA